MGERAAPGLVELEVEALRDRSDGERRLDQRQVIPEAHLRPVAEGEVGVGRNLLPPLGAEAARVEALGVGEVTLVVLGEPGAEDEAGAGRNEVVAELEVGPARRSITSPTG